MKILDGTMIFRRLADTVRTAAPRIDAISSVSIYRAFEVVTIEQSVGYLCDVEQSIIFVQRTCGKADDDVARLRRAANHWFANRQAKEVAMNARRTAVVVCKFVKIVFRHLFLIVARDYCRTLRLEPMMKCARIQYFRKPCTPLKVAVRDI